MESVRQFSDAELNKTEIVHPGNGDKKVLGKYLLRIGYHESVHVGQFLSYLRAMNINRPEIWDWKNIIVYIVTGLKTIPRRI